MLSKACGKRKGKRKGKETGKSKHKLKEGTSDTSNTKCSFCKGKDCLKSLTWPAEKKTMSHELRKLTRKGHSSLSCVEHTMINLVAEVHDGLWVAICTSRRTDVGLPQITGKNLT